MNLIQLRYFVAVARNRSLSRAALELHVAQPAISRQLKLLEDELQTVLLLRHHRGVELTDVGQSLLERAEFQLRSFAQMRAEFIDQSMAPSGQIRMGCPPALTRPILAKPLLGFMSSYPNIKIEVRENISDQLVRAILADGLDMAIASISGSPSHLHVDPLFSERLWLIGKRGLRLPKRVSIKFLGGLPLFIARRDNATRDLVERRAAEASVSLNIVVETDSTQLIEELVIAGVGFTVAPYLGFSQKLEAERLSGAPLEGFSIDRCLIRRKDRPTTRAMQEFSRLLKSAVPGTARERRARGLI